ncbi:hypothetical protein J4E91_006129 [Alternaria rosae]|nr:hypothetical protein J4E91_006129 [Alternaria rosae]
MKAKGESTLSHIQLPQRILHISHVVLPEYVGAEPAKENVQMWYEITAAETCCSSWRVPGRHNLGENLRTVGLDPATALRFLSIEVPNATLVLGNKDSTFQGATSRQDAFNLLLRIKRKAGFKLNFLIYCDCIRLNMWPEILDLLRPTVEVFEQEGAHVSVRSLYDPNGTDRTDESPGVYTDVEHQVRSYDITIWKQSMKQGLVDYFEKGRRL